MRLITGCFIVLLTFGVYLFTSVPCITGGDSGELAGVGATLGITHSPGYPLYSLAGKIFVSIFPFANQAYRVNMLSGLFMALACLLIFFLAQQITNDTLTAFSVSLMFAFSKVVWAIANTTEVYGISAFMVLLICALVLNKDNKKHHYMLVSYLLGAAMTAHYTAGLMGLGILLWFILNYGTYLKNEWKIISANIILFGILGFSVTVFLYVRSKSQPVFDWEDPETLKRFWQVIARLRYGSLALAQGGAPPLSFGAITEKIWFFFKVISENFTWAGTLLFAAGIWFSVKEKTKGLIILLFMIGTGPGFLILANVSLDPGSAALLKRFFFLPFIFVVLIMAKTLNKIPSGFSRLVIFLPVLLIYQNIAALNHRNEYIFYDYAKDMLRTLPLNSILFSDRADEMEFALAYLHKSEGKRPDIEFTDCNAGVSRSIYGDDYYRIWGKPRLAIREEVEKSIINTANRAKRPVFYATFDPGMINIPRYQYGLIYNTSADMGKPFPRQLYWLRISDIGETDNRSLNLLYTYFDLIGRYSLQNNDIEASERYFTGLAAYDKTSQWVKNIGFLYHQKGLIDIAEKYYLRAVNKGTANAEVLTNMGAIYEKRGDRAKAAEVYNIALSLDPNNIQTHFNLAVLYWHDQQWQKVIYELRTVLRLNPGHADALKYLKLAESKI